MHYPKCPRERLKAIAFENSLLSRILLKNLDFSQHVLQDTMYKDLLLNSVDKKKNKRNNCF